MGTYGVKTGGRDFKPGECGNPNGRPRVPDDLKKARKANKVEVERILNEYAHLTLSELKERMNDPATTVMELLLAKIITEGIKKGDQMKLNFIWDRTAGPVKTKLSVDGGEDEKGDTKPLQIELAERIKQATEGKSE